jgi:TonB family protein
MVISVLAFSLVPSGISSPQNFKNKFCVEMVFHQETQESPMRDQWQEQRLESFKRECSALDEEAITPKKPLNKSVAKRTRSDNKACVSHPTPPLTTSEPNHSIPIFNPPPIYPREARRKKVQGVVMVRASLSEEGAVSGATTIPPRIDPLLEEAALRAIRQWRFNPGVRVIEVPIEFKLVV